jgi:hypothetical protein
MYRPITEEMGQVIKEKDGMFFLSILYINISPSYQIHQTIPLLKHPIMIGTNWG